MGTHGEAAEDEVWDPGLAMAGLPFKKIDLENWLQPDPASSGFAKGNDEKGWIHYESEDYLAEVLEPALISGVPADAQ